ncbi:MAG: hypothetical protein A2V66_08840 [Ignavibacteria bacterium RBG_13_36_8]|nr:MAG: hypothetical protein A2V66_08840 [Ignavibacteria bacterium RBG_13_36_8]
MKKYGNFKIFDNYLLLGLFLILLMIEPIKAQKRSFTLEEAVQTALTNNRDVKIAMMEIRKADAAVDEAFGYALPSLDLSANFSHFIKKPMMAFPDFMAMLSNATYGILFDEGVLPRDESKFLTMTTILQSFALANSYTATAQVTQILFNSAVFRGIGASHLFMNLSQEQLKATVAQTVLDVKKAFYGVLLTKNTLEIMEASLLNAEENLKNVQAMYEQGLISEYDALQVEVQVENVRPRVQELRNILNTAKNGLKITLGIEQIEDIDVVGNFIYKKEIIPDEIETVKKAKESNLTINTLMIKKQVDEEFIEIDRSEYWPTIAAFANYSFAGSSDKFDFQNYQSSLVGVTFSLNLFKGGRVANKVEQSKIAALQTEEQIIKLKDFVSMQVKSTLDKLNKVMMQIDAVERNVELAQKAYDIAITRYKEGTGTQLEIKNADVELRQAKTNKMQAIYDYIIANAELELQLGEVDPNHLSFVQNKIFN